MSQISAQESRRKKRDYVELLEKRSEIYGSENSQLRRKVEQLEAKNRSVGCQEETNYTRITFYVQSSLLPSCLA